MEMVIAGQRHDVGLHVEDVQDPQKPHHQEGEQHRQRQRDADDEGAAEVQQNQHDGDGGDDHLVPHDAFRPRQRDVIRSERHGDVEPGDAGERVDGAVDEAGAVVGGDDVDARRQGGLQFLDLLLDAIGDGQRVFAEAHHDGAADGLVAVLLEDAAAELRADLHRGHVLDVDRRAAARGDYRVLNVLGVVDPADAADEVLGVVLLDGPAADGGVAAGDGVVQLGQRDAVGAEGVGVHVDLVLERHPADRADLGHAGHGVDLRADEELLQRPAAAGVEVAAVERVPEDLAQGGGVGRQVRRDAGRQDVAGHGQPLQHALAGEVEIDVVLEDQRDHREVELGRRPHRLDAGQSLQLERKRIGDLVLDLLGAAAHPVGEDDDLVLAQVGHGVHRRVDDGVDGPGGQRRGQDQDEEAIADRIFDQFLDHGSCPSWGVALAPLSPEYRGEGPGVSGH